ncbi:uncharacterized protein LOC111641343 [Centruroides sculpturatus]|uniref:uncharacterized protein LOC111641343 n=1 Tax=Centruroides sculpturatus TaxID=218467 RepID=UPI000C6D7F24|nr:uncharacterized protein LOC111641343 [Centruroides sculpturatus]
MIYKQALELALLYGVQIWREALNNTHLKRKLLSVQRKSAIRICKSYCTAPTNTLLVMANLTPIHLEANRRIWKWFLMNKNFSSSSEMEISTLQNKGKPLKNMNFKSHIVHNNIDNIPNEFNFMTDPKATHPYEISLDFKESTANNKKKQLIAFTDGSKGENGVGSGVVVKNSEGRTLYQAAFKLADHCSIIQAELWSIFKALTYISQLSHITYKKLLVFTDSRAALHILRRENNKSALAKELINLATKLGKQLKISFDWIPGHVGHAGNELADKLAKKASIAHTKITYSRLPISSITKYINQQICALWQTEWEESPTGRLCFKFFPSIEDRQKKKHDIQTIVPNNTMPDRAWMF